MSKLVKNSVTYIWTAPKEVERLDDKKEARSDDGRRFQREGPATEKGSRFSHSCIGVVQADAAFSLRCLQNYTVKFCLKYCSSDRFVASVTFDYLSVT